MAHVSYHNTVPVSGGELLLAVKAAAAQDDAVLILFGSGGVWSPSQVHRYFTQCGHDWPITSVRRAISNLTKAKLLVMTGSSVIGPHGRRENTWSKA